MQSTFLAFGANLGDRDQTLRAARDILQSTPGFNLLACSPLYESDPVGGPQGQPPYLNAVLAATTELAPRQLLELCQQIETDFGRERKEKWGPRTLDIDLLLFGPEIIDEPDLTVPHPRLHERRFVLAPLCDLAPDLVHPRLRKPAHRLLAELDPAQQIRRLDEKW